MTSNAVSIDGRTFTFEVPLADAMSIGSYVLITVDDDRSYLGQVLHEEVVDGPSSETGATRRLAGSGNLLDRGAIFGDGKVALATSARIAEHFDSSLGDDVGIELGDIHGLDGVAARLHASGFGRHTFLCGQSGSGKTYTLGIVIERLLIDTDIRLVVLDPNSDYVNLRNLRPQADTGLSDADYAALSAKFADVSSKVHVFGGQRDDGQTRDQLKAWFSRLTAEQQTMVLGLDPFDHPDEYNAFVRIRHQLAGEQYTLRDVLELARSSFAEDQRKLGMRIENLGVADLSIWAGLGDHGIGDTLATDWRMLVLDLGSLPTEQESSIAAAALLGYLWEVRRGRQPIMLVVDEAHNICPQDPTSANQALATEHLVRIAGEGRKFGIYILLSTQRPDKVHQNVLSQCDNLIMMKMNSATDIRTLSETFSYAPRSLVEQAAGFGLGEGLAAGKIAPDPLLFKSGHRFTMEGGGDVDSSWARRT